MSAPATLDWWEDGEAFCAAALDRLTEPDLDRPSLLPGWPRRTVTALDNAVARRHAEGADLAGCIVHSDRGSQFRSRTFVHALNRHQLSGSMGRVGAAGDNAAMESFFALLPKNVLDRRHWRTRQELRIASVTWIERTYHRRRRQDALGRLTPIEYETIVPTLAAQAA